MMREINSKTKSEKLDVIAAQILQELVLKDKYRVIYKEALRASQKHYDDKAFEELRKASDECTKANQGIRDVDAKVDKLITQYRRISEATVDEVEKAVVN